MSATFIMVTGMWMFPHVPVFFIHSSRSYNDWVGTVSHFTICRVIMSVRLASMVELVAVIMITDMCMFPHVIYSFGRGSCFPQVNANVTDWFGRGMSDVWFELGFIRPGTVFLFVVLASGFRRTSRTCSNIDPRIPWFVNFLEFMQSGFERVIPLPHTLS